MPHAMIYLYTCIYKLCLQFIPKENEIYETNI